MSLTKICSYCGKVISQGTQDGPVSHGLCKSCDRKIRKQNGMKSRKKGKQ